MRAASALAVLMRGPQRGADPIQRSLAHCPSGPWKRNICAPCETNSAEGCP